MFLVENLENLKPTNKISIYNSPSIKYVKYVTSQENVPILQITLGSLIFTLRKYPVLSFVAFAALTTYISCPSLNNKLLQNLVA